MGTILFIVTILIAAVQVAYASNYIIYTANPQKCLEVEDPLFQISNLILNHCSHTSMKQLWNVDTTRFVISTLSGRQCFWIKHKDSISTDFANDPVDITRCRYVNEEGKPRPKGKPVGFQRLIFENGTIVWRGQSKVLPGNMEDRFCVEVESEVNKSQVSLQHCMPGKKEQQFHLKSRWK